jgi:hypothetical protein
MRSRVRLLIQFPWEKAGALKAEEVHADIIPGLIHISGALAQSFSGEPDEELLEVALPIVQVCSP